MSVQSTVNKGTMFVIKLHTKCVPTKTLFKEQKISNEIFRSRKLQLEQVQTEKKYHEFIAFNPKSNKFEPAFKVEKKQSLDLQIP